MRLILKNGQIYAFYLDISIRICFKIIANLFLNLLFGLSVGLLGIFALSILANRPLFIFNEDRLYSLSIVSELTCARWHYPCCTLTAQIYPQISLR